MNNTEIIEGNKLIAEFVNLKECSRCKGCGQYLMGVTYYTPEQMEYHESWDWLMPVVQKIFKIGIPDDSFLHIRIEYALRFADIDLVYPHVLGFIKWYNNQNKQP